MGVVLLAGGLMLAAAAGLVALRRLAAPSAERRRFALGSVVCVVLTTLAAGALHRHGIPETLVQDRPIEVSPPGYVTSAACRPCHPGQYSTWAASFHRPMTQVAGRETVLGDFDDRELRLGSSTFRLTREGGDFWVDMDNIDGEGAGPGGPHVKRRVALTTGTHHMQAYWYATANTRVLGLLPFVHIVETGEWLPRRASFILPPTAEPESELGRWNKTCIECHTTQGRLRPIERGGLGGHDTHVAEFGIACESCHGPGAEHVEAYADLVTRYVRRLAGHGDDHIVQPAKLQHERGTEVCGQCHSTSVWTSQDAIDEFMENGFAYRPGDRLADTKAIVRGRFEWNPPEIRNVLSFQPELLPNTFWSDGMNRVSGREYNGLLETACYLRGEMSCMSCHVLHKKADDPRSIEEWRDDQLKPGMRGNEACLQCHGDYRDATILTRHTHHTAASSGSVCYDCHMPHTTYGLLKAIRSHQIDSPSAVVSVATGRPNACNQCHLDRSLGWTADRLEAWYGIPRPSLSDAQRTVAAIPLLALQGDAGQRAIAAWSLSWPPAVALVGDRWQALYLGILLGDPYPAVRTIAHRSLRRMPGFSEFAFAPMAEPGELYAAGNAALALWRSRPAPERAPPSIALLIDPTGPRMDRLLGLLRSRDDRPVAFAE